jgi:hypothetical protein
LRGLGTDADKGASIAVGCATYETQTTMTEQEPIEDKTKKKKNML